MATEGVAMGQAVAVRTDYTAGEVRGLAKGAKDAVQARRLLTIAAVFDGASRTEAAKIGGMDRQTLRDWVIRFNRQGPDGPFNIPSPGVPPKLDATRRAFLARIVEEGPIPAVHGVVRWRACDLITRLHEEFGSRCRMTPSIVPSRTWDAFKKTSPNAWRNYVWHLDKPASGDRDWRHRRGYGYDRDSGCRDVTIRRDDGSVKHIRRCD